MVDRALLISSFERVEVIVRDYNRMVVMDIESSGIITLRGRAPDFGSAKEELSADAEGENLRIAVNSRFFLEALKVIRDPGVKITFNGQSGHISVRRSDSDDFLCLIAPINMSEEELKMLDRDSSSDGI